jgi:hypothetical protein
MTIPSRGTIAYLYGDNISGERIDNIDMTIAPSGKNNVAGIEVWYIFLFKNQ